MYQTTIPREMWWLAGYAFVTLLAPTSVASLPPLTVLHLVPISHVDTGWLRTFDEYYRSDVRSLVSIISHSTLVKCSPCLFEITHAYTHTPIHPYTHTLPSSLHLRFSKLPRLPCCIPPPTRRESIQSGGPHPPRCAHRASRRTEPHLRLGRCRLPHALLSQPRVQRAYVKRRRMG
jgi:hypothetical protein